MARIVALDLGDARIGVAVSDPLGITAQPLEPVQCVGSRKDLARIERLLREYEAGTVVIGLPRLLSGEEGERAERARAFGAGLQKRLPRLAVSYWDERLTTVEAERLLIDADVSRKRRRKLVDGIAAALILQGYIDSAAGAGSRR